MEERRWKVRGQALFVIIRSVGIINLCSYNFYLKYFISTCFTFRDCPNFVGGAQQIGHLPKVYDEEVIKNIFFAK